MLWPNLNNNDEKKQVDLKYEGLDLFVNIDIGRTSHSSSRLRSLSYQQQKQQRQQKHPQYQTQQEQENRESAFSLSSPFASAGIRYRTKTNTLSELSTPIRNNSSRSSEIWDTLSSRRNSFNLSSKGSSDTYDDHINTRLAVPHLTEKKLGLSSQYSAEYSAEHSQQPTNFSLSWRRNELDQWNDYNHDHDFNQARDDDSSISSTNTVLSEAFHCASIRIDNEDGVIAFEFKDESKDNDSIEQQDMDDERKSNTTDTNTNTTDTDTGTGTIHSTNITIEESKTVKEKRKSPTNNFELSSTSIQVDRDNKKKQFHSLRLACLEVAADQYKKLNIEVPDIIVAQVNEHRSAFSEHVMVDTKVDDDGNQIDDKNKTNDKEVPKQRKRQRIRLRTTDEIHVSPCQCALSLVGMKGKAVDSNISNKVYGESLFGNLLGGFSLNNNHGLESTDSLRSNMSSNPKKKEKIAASSMVRTQSAAVRDDKQMSANGKNKNIPADQKKSNIKLSKHHRSNHHLTSHNRVDSGTFEAVGYHEITLIRNRSVSKSIFTKQKGHINNDYSEFLDWDAITIRCSNHDELDILVRALKDSSKATVIPFSSNPKEKLKLNKKKLRQKAIHNRQRLNSDPVNSFSNIYHRRSPDYCQEITPVGVSSPLENRLSVSVSEDRPLFIKESSEMQNIKLVAEIEEESDIPSKDPTSPVEKKGEENRWDFNFNKKEYCEICDLVFTLLTRRHHCRKCQRSICGNCSSLLLIKGGDEKRFCNLCSADILRKQSEALHGKWKNRYLQSDRLPGKVHPACHRLGVGVMGKLPHWRTFLRKEVDKRPAVGRLTIEVLEAIALPSVDMVNGKVSSYVRATITGYDRDMLWTLREWLPQKRYSLISGYVSSTLSPQWRGSGRKGGELLTLPLISTAGAVLRLEILHYNVMTHARGKDTVLGVVEIPLSDLPNANLRQPGNVTTNADGKKKSLLYDGYCDRWYRLLSSDQANSSSVVLSKPIPSPHLQEAKQNEKKASVGLKSLEEIGKRMQGLCVQPIEWIASAIKLDLPARRPEAIFEEHKSRSMIHVRIKLNASIHGDILSHAWFPPVKPRPVVPPFDPQTLFGRIMLVSRQFAPYRKIQQYIEKVIKWEHEPKICAKAYLVFAIHLALLPYLIKIFHVYLFIFLGIRLREMMLQADDDDNSEIGQIPHVDSMSSADVAIEVNSEQNFQNSPSLTELHPKPETIEYKSLGTNQDDTVPNGKDDEEIAKLNIAVSWIAKKWLDNKGLEILQFKLGRLGRDLKNLNSVWNGNNPLLTRAAMVCLAISFALHFVINTRLLWLMGTFAWFFGRSPICVLGARMFFGFWRGIAKGLRRQHLLDAEVLGAM